MDMDMMQISEKARRRLANCMLLFTGALWGGGFVVMKNALDAIPVNYLLAMRFSIGALGLCYTLFSKTHPLNKRVLLGGVATGFFMYAAFATQTYGLMFTTAGKNALITAVYVVLVPLVLWAWRGVKPTRRIMGSAAIMLAGVALLSLQGEGGVNIGDFLTFLCGILYAVHICVVDAFADQDVMQLTCLQFTFAALFAWMGGLAFETFPAAFTLDMVGALAARVMAEAIRRAVLSAKAAYGYPAAGDLK